MNNRHLKRHCHWVKYLIIAVVLVFFVLCHFLLNKLRNDREQILNRAMRHGRMLLDVHRLHSGFESDDTYQLNFRSQFENDARLYESLLKDHVSRAISNKNFTNSSLIFIGGYQRSGTTLMRAILDTHEDIYCGPETKLLPALLSFLTNYYAKNLNTFTSSESGIDPSQLHMAIATFVYTLLENHDETMSHKRPCDKDPDILYYMEYLHQLFPNAKFVYMVRDGRAAAYSLIRVHNEPRTFDKLKVYLKTWNDYNKIVLRQCKSIGEQRCLLVKYEDLVLRPKDTLIQVMSFLNETFSDDQLHHEKFIGSRVRLSKTEWSSHQVVKKINKKSLCDWIENPVKDYSTDKLDVLYPMLEHFNYSIDIKNLNYF